MGARVTESERQLIEDLLLQHSADNVARIVGRGRRTVYYIAAEMQRRPIKKTVFTRFMETLRGDKNDTVDTTRARSYRRSKV